MYVHRELPAIPVGDWAAKHDLPNPDRTAWRGRLTREQSQRMRAGYMGCITHIDYEFGRMLEMLDRAGARLSDNSLLIVTADHGDMMGDHHLHRKTYAYEGSARIPFVIRYPRGLSLPAGRFEHVVGLQDVMPTILDVLGIPIPASVTGASVLKAIRGESWREFFHGEHSPCYDINEAMQYLTDGKEKYIWFPHTGQEQFFDLRDGRQELCELSKSPAHAARAAMWRQRLTELLGKRGDGFSDGRQLLVRKERWGPVVKK
jgi:arylsulfatase A-like enzyme